MCSICVQWFQYVFNMFSNGFNMCSMGTFGSKVISSGTQCLEKPVFDGFNMCSILDFGFKYDPDVLWDDPESIRLPLDEFLGPQIRLRKSSLRSARIDQVASWWKSHCTTDEKASQCGFEWFQCVLSCFGLFWVVLSCFGLFWVVLRCFELF